MRKIYIIDKNFQVKFIVKFCIIVVVASVLLAGFVLWFSDNSTTVTIENTKVVVKNTVDFIYPVVFQSLLVAAVFSAVSVGVLTMFMTHKIAGPLYRLRTDVERLKEGDYRVEFKIRQGDQLGDFSTVLADAASTLRARNAVIVNEMQGLKQALSGLDIDEVEINDHINAIDAVLENIKL